MPGKDTRLSRDAQSPPLAPAFLEVTGKGLRPTTETGTVCARTRVCMCTHMRVHLCAMHLGGVCMFACACACMFMCACVCMHVHTCAHTAVCVCVCACACGQPRLGFRVPPHADGGAESRGGCYPCRDTAGPHGNRPPGLLFIYPVAVGRQSRAPGASSQSSHEQDKGGLPSGLACR